MLYADYSVVKPPNDHIKAKEILFKESVIKLKDTIIGVPNIFEYVNFLEYTEGITIDKPSSQDPFTQGHTRMVKFYNLFLARERGIYFR